MLREPLLHFVLLGAALFGWSAWHAPTRDGTDRRVVVSSGLQENLRAGYTRNTGLPPTPAIERELIADFVREEILMREALALGLHHDDPIVRVQLRQRMEFVEASAAEIALPTEADLQAFLEAHPGQFRTSDNAPRPLLADIRPRVERAWRSARRQEALDRAYAATRARYEVVIEGAEARP